MFVKFRLLKVIKTDNGSPMIGEQFSQYLFMKSLEVNHMMITPQWPQGNGTVERFMTLGKVIKTATQWEMEEIVKEKFMLSHDTKTPCNNQPNTPALLPFHGKIKYLLPEMKNDDDEVVIIFIRFYILNSLFN